MSECNRQERALEFDKILTLLSSFTSCEDSREAALALRPETELAAAEKLLRQTDDAHRLLAKFGGPSFGGLCNVDNALARASAGGVLNPGELLRIAEVLRVIRALKEWYNRQAGVETCLDGLFCGLLPNRFLEEKINGAILAEDKIADGASAELSRIRREMRRKADSIRQKLDQMIHSQTYQKYLQDSLVTQRNGRFVVPVKSEYRSEIGGLVHDTSSSGATVFIEPAAVVEANNDIKVLQSKERDEIERILTALSAETGMEKDSIQNSYRCALRLDLIFAKARLAYAMNGVCPALNDRGIVDLIDARHPLLPKESVVPVHIFLGEDFDTLIITGPNTGGKTVSIKTVGLLTLMASAGMMIPAAERSRVCIFSSVYADIGDEQSIEQSLSTFSSHMVHIISILQQAGPGSLVLIDELGAGTDPIEGAALATAILERLRAQGCKVAATTHYAELKAYALQTPGVENGCCEFDVASLRPTYRLLIGVPGRSNAFAITERLGMDPAVVERARELVSAENTRFEEVVDSLEKSRVEMEKQQKKTQQDSLLAEQLLRQAREEKEKARQEAEREKERARGESRRLLENTRRQAAALAEEIRQLQKQAADKNQLREIAARAKKMLRQDIPLLDADADPVSQNGEDENYRLPRALQIGDRVRLSDLGSEAEIVSLPDSKGMVEVRSGMLKTRVKVANVRLIEGKKKNAARATIHTQRESLKTAAVSNRCDLRGMSADEAILELDRFLDAAVMAKLEELTVVHGKGTGVLRAAVAKYLKGNPAVKSFRSGRYGEGEDGVTIVTLK